MARHGKQHATLYRMVTDQHICPFGLKARDLLEREGFELDDRKLRSREETDAFQDEHGVATTPQIWIGERRIGGYDALREHLGKTPANDDKPTYGPVIAIFAMAALMAAAAALAAWGTIVIVRAAEWVVAFAMCLLAVQKLRDLEGFSNTFLGYDLLARKWVRYAYVYPFAEAGAGVLMIAGTLTWLAAPAALFIGTVGAVSVFKAVYVDGRELKCACVGGDSNVPLGAVSLTENLMMAAMGLWMGAGALGLRG
ncbi:MAG: MauE/DoxX family redox-associated membrane protein [Sphingomonadales bacterium]